MTLTMINLENNFKAAKQSGAKFVGILVRMEGFPKDEVIINQHENIDSKLAYYQKTYDENLQHKFAKGISIVAFTHGQSFDDIEQDLLHF